MPPPETEQPSYYVVRRGPTDRITYLASRRTRPLELFWTRYRSNAAMYYEDAAQERLLEAKALANPFMEFFKELVKPVATS